MSEHKGLVFKVVNASGATPEDRNDVFQEITIQLWKSVPGLGIRDQELLLSLSETLI